MTDPAGTVALDAVVTVPTARPAAVRLAVAAACVRLTTFGTLDPSWIDVVTTSNSVVPSVQSKPI